MTSFHSSLEGMDLSLRTCKASCNGYVAFQHPYGRRCARLHSSTVPLQGLQIFNEAEVGGDISKETRAEEVGSEVWLMFSPFRRTLSCLKWSEPHIFEIKSG